MKAILSDVVNEYNDRVERLDNTQEELTTIIGQQEERNKKLLLLKNEIDQLSNNINKNKSRKEILIGAIENKSYYWCFR